MTAKRRSPAANVKGHKRRTASGVVHVKPYCRRPPKRGWQKAAEKQREWGF